MKLKSYQGKVMEQLSSYLTCLDDTNDLIAAWHKYWMDQDIPIGMGGVPPYHNAIPGVPHVCMKVPTGGGKTFMACAALKRLFRAMPQDKPKVVVWLVPSDSILSQTTKALTNTFHPYRERLDMDFSGRVGVYTKEQLLSGQNFSPDTVTEMLTVCILSYGSLRIDSKKKDVRKVYQENGGLLSFADYFHDREVLLADTPDTALIQVLRQLAPVVIVDESHNAGSDLSVEMLRNLNPSFILDLTATPRTGSNIISYVDARELKKENMVKLPVIVYNRSSQQSVIQDAIQLRDNLEKLAQAEEADGGQYIRPIVLFQAQPNIKGTESETYQKIKATLIAIGIPQEEIAVKTSDVDDLKNVDLLDRGPVRYIITVNALKEGWDCPFAYILASLANKTSVVDVEQIVGRILRQPYAREHQAPLLNSSYVLTCSNDFRATLENIVSGLNRAGFSRKDYRVGDAETPDNSAKESPRTYEQMIYEVDDSDTLMLAEPSVEYGTDDGADTFADISVTAVREELQQTEAQGAKSVRELTDTAARVIDKYQEDLKSASDENAIGGELGEMLTQNQMQPQYQGDAKMLCIPQFFIQSTPDLFGGEWEFLEAEDLSDGFLLAGQDAQISFALDTGEMYQVDLQREGDAVPKYQRVSRSDNEYLREYLARLPEEKRLVSCIDHICTILNRKNQYGAKDIENYVRRIVGNMKEDALSAMETSLAIYTKKIQDKIEGLEAAYREEQFYKLIDGGKIICKENYHLPEIITPAETIDSIPYSLYTAERDDMNRFERKVLDVIAGLPNIQWWHRIIDRKGFRLNGFINHYPDFLVYTKNGCCMLIEAKADYLDGDNSKTKLKLGKRWESLSGRMYRYYMVFMEKKPDWDGAYTLDGFAEMVKTL